MCRVFGRLFRSPFSILETIMSKLDNVETIVSQLSTDLGELTTAVSGIGTDVQAALDKLSTLNASVVTDADLATLANQLGAIDQGVKSATAGLNASKIAIDTALNPTPAPSLAEPPAPESHEDAAAVGAAGGSEAKPEG